MATTPQNHQDQKDYHGQLLVVTMRRPQRCWVGRQDQQWDGGQLLIVATKKPWQWIRPQYNKNHKGDDD